MFRKTTFFQDNKLVLRELKYIRGTVLLAIIFPLLSAAFEGFGIGFLFAFLQTIVNSSHAPFRVGVEWFDIWILGSQTSMESQLYRICSLILISTWMRAVFNYFSAFYGELTKLKLVDRLNQKIFDQIQSLEIEFFNKSHSGDTLNLITTEMSRLQQAASVLNFAIYKFLAGSVYIFILLKISWQLAVVSAFLFGLIMVLISTLNGRIREDSFPVSTANSRFTANAIELINGIKTIQAFGTQGFERKRFLAASAHVVDVSIRSQKSYLLVRPVLEGLVMTVLIGMIILGLTIFVENGTLQTATLLTFLLVLFRLLPALQEVSGSLASFSGLQGSIKSISDFLKTDDKVYLSHGTRQYSGLKEGIELENVSFAYNPDKLVLKNINLSICKGETIALVGSSGAGKTTLADLIPRFYDPTGHGQITIDGINLKAFDINAVRRKMAIVSQDTFIFNASVRNNIAYGLPDVSDYEILEAARSANAFEFIQNLPQGLDTPLGERGTLLSGGQRQRIAIARALLRNPEILILDEATSALDSISERLIQDAIEKLSVGRTVIAIAHRLSTIMRADKVVVMQAGEIVEQGTYQELLQLKGELWKYHRMQNDVRQPAV
jgi:subfamily B ATP-binding cassette protein MsbA